MEDITQFEPWQRSWQRLDLIQWLPAQFSVIDKALLIAILKNESREKRVCFASMTTLAREVGCDRRSAQRSLKRLVREAIVLRKAWPGVSASLNLNWQLIQCLSEKKERSRPDRVPLVGVPAGEGSDRASQPHDTVPQVERIAAARP